MAVFNLGKINKKVLIAIPLIIVLVSSLGGIFLWLGRETPPEEWEGAEYSKPEDYVVKETPEGKIMENEKAGLSFMIPEGWRIEKPSSDTRNFVRLYSLEAEEKNALVMEKGCRIVPDVQYITTSTDTIKEELSKGVWKSYLLSTEIVSIDNRKGLRYVAESEELGFYRMGVGIPTKGISGNNRVYSFVLDVALKDKEWCAQAFERFLETVSIK